MLATGADPRNGTDYNTEWPSRWNEDFLLALTKNPKILKLFLKNTCVDVNKMMVKKTSLLEFASSDWYGKRETLESVKLLLAAGANLNYGHRTSSPLLNAARAGFTETVKVLLAAGVDVNFHTKGKTPLILASCMGYTEIVKLLIACGANVNHQDVMDQTALICASSENHTEIVKVLLAAGSNINHQNENDQTALSLASSKGLIGYISYDRKIKARAKYKESYAETVKVLLACGANINLRNLRNRTALSSARLEGHTEIVRLLKAAGAKE